MGGALGFGRVFTTVHVGCRMWASWVRPDSSTPALI